MPAPLKLHGAKLSYYTGKMEGYLRYKEIPFEFVPMGPSSIRRIHKKTGAGQMPSVELPDGRFMTDTTPMIDWFESEYPKPAVIPTDPLQGFFSRLVEDYAEEWLWRPAMHFRWSYRKDALLLSRRIATEIMGEIRMPLPMRSFLMRRRQGGKYVREDGVSKDTWDHVEGCYFKTLDQLEAIFSNRPYLLGETPTLADFGFFASLFRHFSQDPTPAELMRERAPGVYEWQARLWNARASRISGNLAVGIPDDWGPILDEIGSAYLPYLCANAEGWKSDQKRHDAEIQGIAYRDLPVSQYRVWCLERLREHYEGLPQEAQEKAKSLLQRHGCWEPLFRIENTNSRYKTEDIPFRGRKVHYHNAS